MFTYTKAETTKDLEGILALQRANLSVNLTPEEKSSNGFVTVVHSLAALQKMNGIEPHIIAKQNDTVVAYLLAMTPASEKDIPVLQPMFQMFRQINFRGQPVSAARYIVVGQACVSKACRGQGVLDQCYHKYREVFSPSYQFAITEIAITNTRSVQAHKRIGFDELHRYKAPDSEEWSIVVWNW